jgi:hypothetical protein
LVPIGFTGIASIAANLAASTRLASIAADLVAPIVANLAASICISTIGFASIAASFSLLPQ